MTNIFISHKRDDREIAGEIAGGLRAAGHEAVRTSDLGKDYVAIRLVLAKEIRRSDILFAVITPRSAGDLFVAREVDAAVQGGKPAVLLLLGIDHVDAYKASSRAFRKAGVAVEVYDSSEGIEGIVEFLEKPAAAARAPAKLRVRN